jgi:hypothetical protein
MNRESGRDHLREADGQLIRRRQVGADRNPACRRGDRSLELMIDLRAVADTMVVPANGVRVTPP